MKLPELAIRYAPFTVVVFVALLVLGSSAFFNMSRQEDPIILVPGAVVYFSYPGAQANDLEELILNPVEQALNELADIRFIRSRAENGLAIVNVEFEYGKDPDQTYNDVVEKVNSISADLPEGIVDTRFRKKSNNNTVMLQLALVGPEASYRELEDWGEILRKRIRRVKGVKLAELRGVQRQEVQILVNPDRLSQMGMSLPQLAQIIQASNLNVPGGAIQLGHRQLSLQTSGSFQSLDEIRNMVVASLQGNPVMLKQLAEVRLDYPQERYLVRMNGKKAIFLTVIQQESSNIFKVQEGIKQLTEDFSPELPTHIQIVTAFEQAALVEGRINGFLANLLQGIFLVGIVIFLALGGRSSLIVMLAIPFSILIGLGIIYQLGFGLQQMSIAALVVALGLLVDNSIAIVENIERFLQMGYSRREAAIEGTRQLAWPISSATATTLLAFFPLVMMPEKAGDFLKSMPLTVMATLAASLLIALSLTPLIARHFLPQLPKKRSVPPLELISSKVIQGPYVRSLRWVLNHPWLSMSLAVLLLAGSLALIPQVGLSFFPKAERPQFLIRIQTASGSQLIHSDEICQKVENSLSARAEIAHFASNIGKGNARVYYNVYENSYESNYADILVQTHRYEEREFQQLVDELKKEFAQIPEAEIRLVVFEQGIVTEAPIEVRLTGDDPGTLKALSLELEAKLESVPGLIELDNPLRAASPMLRLNLDKEKAGLLGVSLAELDQTLRISVAGREVSRYREKDGYAYPIRLQLSQSGHFNPGDLDRIYVRNIQGRALPLAQIAQLEFSSSPNQISHYDLERYSSLTADADDAYLLDEVVSEVERRLEAFDWPVGYGYQMAGEREQRNETFGGMGQAAIIALLLIFGVLVLQFQSFLQPLIIFAAIPMAAIGSIWALFFAGLTFSLTAVVGMISLIGIVINDSIVLVDFANRELEAGKSIEEALVSAGKVRFMPILLTSLTTIGGLIPLTIQGGSLWAPMSTVMIGGLIASTFLILVFVPVLYSLFTRKNRNQS